MAFLIFASFLWSCQTQQKPTEVKETSERIPIESVYAIESPLEITESTVVLDARSLFEYASGHLPGSVNLQWQDFSQKSEGHQGFLQKDVDALVGRLALVGISPDTPVIVVGRGTQGRGEEGRIAWMLSYLGVEEVTAVPVSYFEGQLTTKMDEAPENAKLWRARPNDTLLVEPKEMLSVLANPGAQDKKYTIIDVRSTDEYLESSQKKFPDLGAINIPWTDFFSESGRPEVSLIPRLQDVGIARDQRIILVSNQGVRSAAVTMALRELGFAGAGNFAGGYKALVRQRK